MRIFGERYELGALIGAGGMSDVFVAKDLRLNREVAVKVLRSDLNREQTFVTRFRKEALAAAGLSHPGIVAVYDSGETPAPYIVMELLQGKTLRELINGPVDAKTARVRAARTCEEGYHAGCERFAVMKRRNRNFGRALLDRR